jgi:hypothetical protein
MAPKKEKPIVVGEDISFHALHKWYKHAFKHLGYMLLAQKSKNYEKVMTYVHSLAHLKHDIEHKLENIRDKDKINDLKIMWTQLNILIEHTNKDFGLVPEYKKEIHKEIADEKVAKNKEPHMHDVTYIGLNKWYNSEFKKLGWMILAKKYGYNEKVTTYVHCLIHLKKSLHRKYKTLHDYDSKRDIEIMLANLNVLIEHVNKDF